MEFKLYKELSSLRRFELLKLAIQITTEEWFRHFEQIRTKMLPNIFWQLETHAKEKQSPPSYVRCTRWKDTWKMLLLWEKPWYQYRHTYLIPSPNETNKHIVNNITNYHTIALQILFWFIRHDIGLIRCSEAYSRCPFFIHIIFTFQSIWTLFKWKINVSSTDISARNSFVLTSFWFYFPGALAI